MRSTGDLPAYDAFPHPVYGVMDSVGAAFALGGASGAAFHFVRGLVRGAPGCGGRLVAGVRAARTNAPRVAGTLGSYWFVLSTIEYAVSRAQGREVMDSAAVTLCRGFSVSAGVAATAATFCLAGMRRGGVPAAARYVLYCAAGVAVMAEIDRTADLLQGEKCLRRNQMNSEQPAAPAVLRPKSDGCRGLIRPLGPTLVEDVSFRHN